MKRRAGCIFVALTMSAWLSIVGGGRATASPSTPAGDFNGDGNADLAVGVPGWDTTSASGASVTGAGEVIALYGTSGGLEATSPPAPVAAQRLSRKGVTGPLVSGAGFGTAVAVGDLNGDGFDDLAVGAPGDLDGGQARAGSVNVIYGSANGLDPNLPAPLGSQLFAQSEGSVPGAARAGDAFGRTLTIGDFNGDGYGDLAIGIPGKDVGTQANAGAVDVLYGSATGLGSGLPGAMFTQNTPGIAGVASSGASFGAALAAADFGNSGAADLAVGSPGYPVVSAGAAGAINVLYGGAAGLNATNNRLFTQNTGAVPGSAQAGDRFGASLAAADFGGAAQSDLAVGIPLKDVGSAHDAGAVAVLYGGGAGLSDQGSVAFNESNPDIPGDALASDRFGASLAGGSFDGSAPADLAIGAPGEAVSGQAGAGVVDTVFGSSTGIVLTNAQQWSQDSPNVADKAQSGDAFGARLVAGDFDNSGTADLAIGTPGEDMGKTVTKADAGAVNVLYGSTTGLTDTGNQIWTAANTVGSIESGDRFGSALG